MRIPLFLITGYLGSGKTTFVENMIHYYADSKRIAIVQNEFASANIDGKELKNTGKAFEIMEINNGSVFCVCLLDSFIDSLSAFLDEKQPDALFIEASGLSDPIGIAQIVHSSKLSDKLFLSQVWCVVDAVNAPVLLNNTRVSHQVRIADKIILNKTDLAKDDADGMHQRLKSINPMAEIIKTSYCRVKLDSIFTPFQLQPVADRMESDDSIKSEGKPDVKSLILKSNSFISPDDFYKFEKETLQAAIRVKGYVKISERELLHVQKVFHQVEYKKVHTKHGMTELIILGKDLNVERIKMEFKKL
jgi:G3E family GTPase